MGILWILLLIGFVVLEIATTQFICIWFAGGSLAALICAMLNMSLKVQTVVFVIVSALLLVFTKQFVDKLKSKDKIKTNADALIGQSGVVLEDISNIDSKGSVKLRGLEWSARSSDGSDIPANSHVTVREIDGVKLIVDKVSQ